MTRYAGIDAHTGDLHVTVLDEDGEEVDHFTSRNDGSGFETITERLYADDHIAIEACDPAYPVVEHLLREGIDVHVGHPTKLSQLMDPELKDDDRDSWHLADLLRVGRFRRHTIRIPTRSSAGTCSDDGKISVNKRVT